MTDVSTKSYSHQRRVVVYYNGGISVSLSACTLKGVVCHFALRFDYSCRPFFLSFFLLFLLFPLIFLSGAFGACVMIARVAIYDKQHSAKLTSNTGLRSLRHYLRAQSQGHHTTPSIAGREEAQRKRKSWTTFLERTRKGHRQGDELGTASEALLGKPLKEQKAELRKTEMSGSRPST